MSPTDEEIGREYEIIFKKEYHINWTDKSIFIKGYRQAEKDMKEKIEKLKKEISDLYHSVGKIEVWRANNDGVCDLCEDYVLKKIEELFGEKEC